MTNENLDNLLDDYAKGKLPEQDRYRVQERMLHDEAFRNAVEEHVRLVNAMRVAGERSAIKQKLAGFSSEVAAPKPAVTTSRGNQLLRKYWPMAAVAASVALVSIVGTLLMTQSLATKLETKQTAIYKELRKSFEQIQKSQNRMMENIAKSSEKPTPPGRYGGSGFLVSPNGYVVTSHHVVVGADSVFVENPAHGRLKTTVVMSDQTNDVAILRIDDPAFKSPRTLAYTVSGVEANLGEEVYTLGFPREDIVFGEGSISALSGYRQNPNSYQVSVPVNPGNSGGPLFNSKGDLVGIISGIQTETMGAAFAIKSSVLLSVIDSLKTDSLSAPLILPRQNMLKGLSTVDKVKKWKDHVFIVRVYAPR